MQVEYPENTQLIQRAGWGIRVIGKPGTYNVFHFPIPTPVIINDNRLKVGNVLVRFNTSSDEAMIKHLYVNDGAKQGIAKHENINLAGNVVEKRFGVPGKPDVYYGIDIVLHARFRTGEAQPYMTFEAAGCDFLPP